MHLKLKTKEEGAKEKSLKEDKSSLFLPEEKNNLVLSFMRKTKNLSFSLVVKLSKNLFTLFLDILSILFKITIRIIYFWCLYFYIVYFLDI